VGASEAAEQKRIAQSKSLGVAVNVSLNSKGEWCSASVPMQIDVDKSETLSSPKFKALLPKLGQLLVQQCAELEQSTVTIRSAVDGTQLQSGVITASSNWVLEPIAAAIPRETDSSKTSVLPIASNATEASAVDNEVSEQASAAQASQAAGNDTASAKEEPLPVPTKQVASSSEVEKVSPESAPEKAPKRQSYQALYENASSIEASGAAKQNSLVGDWRVEFACGENEHKFDLSIYQFDGEKFEAYLNWPSLTRGRGKEFGGIQFGSGYYLPSVDSLSFSATSHIAEGELGKIIFKGKAAKEASFELEPLFRGCNSARMIRVGSSPQIAIAISKEQNFLESVTQWRSSVVRGSEFGRLSEGTFNLPSCASLKSWLDTYPLDVKRDVTSRRATYLHFLDEVSSDFFGTPAYYWDAEDFSSIEKFTNGCYRNDQLSEDDARTIIRSLVPSAEDALRQRRDIDRQVAQRGVQLGGLGRGVANSWDWMSGYPADSYVNRNLPSYAVEADKIALLKEVSQIRAFYSELYLEEVESDLIEDVDRLGAIGESNVADLISKVDLAVSAINKIQDSEGLQAKKSAARDRLKGLVAAKAASLVEAKIAEFAAPMASLAEYYKRKNAYTEFVENKLKGMLPEQIGAEIHERIDNQLQKSGETIIATLIDELDSISVDRMADKAGITEFLRGISANIDALESAGLSAVAQSYEQEVADRIDDLANIYVDLELARLKQAFSEDSFKSADEIGVRDVNEWLVRSFSQLENLYLNRKENWVAEAESAFQELPHSNVFADRRNEVITAIAAGIDAAIDLSYRAMYQGSGLSERSFTLSERSVNSLKLPKEPREEALDLVRELNEVSSNFVPVGKLKALIDAKSTPVYLFEEPDLAHLNDKQSKTVERIIAEQAEVYEAVTSTAVELMRVTASRRDVETLGNVFDIEFWLVTTKLASEIDSDFNSAYENLLAIKRFERDQICSASIELDDLRGVNVLAGFGIVDMQSFACALKASVGLSVRELIAPSLFGGDDYVLRGIARSKLAELTFSEGEENGEDVWIISQLTLDGETKLLTTDQSREIALDLITRAQRQTGMEFGAVDLRDGVNQDQVHGVYQ